MKMYNGRVHSLALIPTLVGVINAVTYDAIVIGAGAGGCPLAQTLIEGGKKVLLLERGEERGPATENINVADDVLFDQCVESRISRQGVVVASGNCMGGSTSVNLGIWINESPKWLIETVENIVGPDEDFFDEDTIADAFSWVTERLAPEPTQEIPGSGTETFIQEVFSAMASRDDLDIVNVDPGQPSIPSDGGIWRTHSTFEPVTGRRRSADTILDRQNQNLEVRTHAEVDKVLFDGDEGIPSWAIEPIEAGSLPTARCVHLMDGGVDCVKSGGRTFISAGALHTPVLLMKSGIGPAGVIVDNPEVGQHLTDKPIYQSLINFNPGFDLGGQLTLGNIASIAKTEVGTMGEERTLLSLVFSAGFPIAFNLLAFQCILVPTFLRDSKLAEVSSTLLKTCGTEKGMKLPICAAFLPLIKAGCVDQLALYGSLISDPSSEGNITLGPKGNIEIDCNYLNDSNDIEALGSNVRSAFEILKSLNGPSAPQQPCDSKSGPLCKLKTCPDILKAVLDASVAIISMVYPKTAEELKFLKDVPASEVFLPTVEWGIDQGMDNFELGKLMSTSIASPHHFSSTARIGSVVDTKFKVMGTEGLYVADASVFPKVTRVNPMPTTMAIGRLAGLSTP